MAEDQELFCVTDLGHKTVLPGYMKSFIRLTKFN